jgi:hypothetical protein
VFLAPVTLDRPVAYDLRELHRNAPIVLTQSHRRSRRIPFRITRSSHARWPYARVVLRFRIALEPNARPGFGYVDMYTGTGPSASVEFYTHRRRGSLVTRWDIVNTEGQQVHHTRRTTFGVTHPNYMLYRDARAGLHHLWFRLEAFKGFRVRRVVISPRTSIRLTARGPGNKPRIGVTATRAGRAPPTVGRETTFGVIVRNEGGSTARGIRLSVVDHSGARVSGPPGWQEVKSLRSGAVTSRRLTFVPTRPGPQQLTVTATSSAGRASTVGHFVAEPAADPGGPSTAQSPWPFVLAAAACAGLLTVLRRRGRRRRAGA